MIFRTSTAPCSQLPRRGPWWSWSGPGRARRRSSSPSWGTSPPPCHSSPGPQRRNSLTCYPSNLIPQTSNFIPQTSYLIPHTSYLIPHTSNLKPHFSCLIPHISYLIIMPMTVRLWQQSFDLLYFSKAMHGNHLFIQMRLSIVEYFILPSYFLTLYLHIMIGSWG